MVECGQIRVRREEAFLDKGREFILLADLLSGGVFYW